MNEIDEEIIKAYGLVNFWWNEMNLQEYKKESIEDFGYAVKKWQEAQDNLRKIKKQKNHASYLDVKRKATWND